jgi:hypothetical protein
LCEHPSREKSAVSKRQKHAMRNVLEIILNSPMDCGGGYSTHAALCVRKKGEQHTSFAKRFGFYLWKLSLVVRTE